MKNKNLAGLTLAVLRSAAVIAVFGAGSLMAQPTVKTMGGGVVSGSFGFKNTNTLFALFHTPMGMAISQDGNSIFVADRDNNAVRLITDFQLPNNGWTFTFTTNFLNKPVGVALDAAGNIYVLNRGTNSAVSTNGTVVEFDQYGYFVMTNASGLTNAAGIALDPFGNIYVSERSNLVVEISGGNNLNTVAAVNLGTNVSLQGIAILPGGQIAACDSGRNGVYIITPNLTNGDYALVTTNAGFNGAGDGTGINNQGLPINRAKFFQPMGVAAASDGTLIVSDYGNGHVKVITTSGIVTNFYGVISNDWAATFPGWVDGKVVVPDLPGGIAGRLPEGVALSPDGTAVWTTEDFYHLVRKTTGQSFQAPVQPLPATPTGFTATLVTNGTSYAVDLTWNSVINATRYAVQRGTSQSGPFNIIQITSGTSFIDSNVVPANTYYYVVEAENVGGVSPNTAPIRVDIPAIPPLAPAIGWFDFPLANGFLSQLHPVPPGIPAVANNPLNIGIAKVDTNLVQTYYITIPPQTNNTTFSYVTNSGHTPPVYIDGNNPGPNAISLYPQLPFSLMSNGLVTIEAVNMDGNHVPSAVTSATFLFQVGAISLIGTNAAQFTLVDVTTNLIYHYTTDGSDPLTNANAHLFIATSNSTPFSILISSNFVFQVVGTQSGYAPSPTLKYTFLGQNFQVTTLSWGFESGYCSSEFVAAPGEIFYAPVTMTTLPGTQMYGLEFNMIVTNLGPDAVVPGGYGFVSMLQEPIIGTTAYKPIPPLEFEADFDGNPPPAGLIQQYNDTNFVSLLVTNNSLNELSAGWFEIAGQTNLFNTKAQNLLTYSAAFIEQIPNAQFPNKDIVGGYSFQVPATAVQGEQYQIQLNRASANGDGLGGPNSAVPIALPLDGSLTNGAINAIKIVTVGHPKYLAGDIYPFQWFNAGDFGWGSLTNFGANDVEATFNAAVYGVNVPAIGSDFYDAMDSAGGLGTYNAAAGYWVPSGTLSGAGLYPLYDVNNVSTINAMPFGDNKIDICDVFVTYVRSQFGNLNWFERFYTNDPAHSVFGRVALAINPQTNIFGNSLSFQSVKPGVKGAVTSQPVSITNTPLINFAATDILASAGQTLTIPINATTFGPYPVRMLALNVSVVPLDGSPALTTAAQFTPNPALATAFGIQTPVLHTNQGPGNYAAAWLPSGTLSQLPGLSGNANIGSLTVTIPATATSSSSYAIHFDSASASPSGLASLPKKTLTGLITLSDRSSSHFGDGIPDSWRLRYFGTIYNDLSVSNADADGTGMNNYQKYHAGLNPTDPTSVLNAGTDQPMASSPQDHVVYWPSVSGQTYVIERSPTLFPAKWTSVATVTGDGSYMEIHDAPAGDNYFYRVRTQ
jgi:hypothetical protein